jgi:hypothetical protein
MIQENYLIFNALIHKQQFLTQYVNHLSIKRIVMYFFLKWVNYNEIT